MVVGTLEVRLLVRESRTLKDKRQVVRSHPRPVRVGFNVSAAEVDTHDDVKVATLGLRRGRLRAAAVQNVLAADAARRCGSIRSRSTSAAR